MVLPDYFEPSHARFWWWEVNFDTLPVGTIQAAVFTGSLSNFICKLYMMRGGTPSILGHGVKFHGQLWPHARGCHALRYLVKGCTEAALNHRVLQNEGALRVIILCICSVWNGWGSPFYTSPWCYRKYGTYAALCDGLQHWYRVQGFFFQFVGNGARSLVIGKIVQLWYSLGKVIKNKLL